MFERVDTNEGEGLRAWAFRALGRACGVNFFADKERWHQWWRANRDRFPSAADASRREAEEDNSSKATSTKNQGEANDGGGGV